MAESTRQTGQDHSKFDNMSTAELNEYLRQDSYCEDSNLDDILYVMEVLERREKEDGNYSPPDVQKAWAEFQKYYNTEDNDGKPLRDFDDEFDDMFGSEPTAEIISIKKARKGLRRTVKSLISVAAAIFVVIIGSVTAKALGYDIWDAVIVWTKDTFGFETTVNGPKPSEYVKQIPEELVELKNLLTEHGLQSLPSRKRSLITRQLFNNLELRIRGFCSDLPCTGLLSSYRRSCPQRYVPVECLFDFQGS